MEEDLQLQENAVQLMKQYFQQENQKVYIHSQQMLDIFMKALYQVNSPPPPFEIFEMRR